MTDNVNTLLNENNITAPEKRFLNLSETSNFASAYLNKPVSVSNISYLLQSGRIKKYGDKRNILVDVLELIKYYDSLNNFEYKQNRQKMI